MTSADDAPLEIFLVEDNEDIRSMLEQLLSSSGFEVHTADSMQAALRDFPKTTSEVLLSDLGLPDGDGWALLRGLREAGCTPYAIAMSGFGTLADVAASKAAGFQHHLVKPVALEDLEALLEQVRRELSGSH